MGIAIQRKVPGFYACGRRWGAGLGHFLSLGKIHWDVSTKCLVRCGAENCCVGSELPNDCTMNTALRNASFPWMHTFTYLPTLPLFLKDTSPLQLCRWQLSTLLCCTHTQPQMWHLCLSAPPLPLPKLPFHATVPANFSMGRSAFTCRLFSLCWQFFL